MGDALRLPTRAAFIVVTKAATVRTRERDLVQ
jgi:hypothetical protein